jgi:hypothetical protein
MATQDWIRFREDSIFNGNVIFAFRRKDNRYKEIRISKEYGKYSVVTPTEVKRESFNTPSQALSYAKNYMKEN